MRHNRIIAVLGVALLTCFAARSDGAAGSQSQFDVQISIYRVATNVTGNGLISQTLPGDAGSFQIVHEKLDDVELAMEGEKLAFTLNGAPMPPKHPGIECLGAPKMTTSVGHKMTLTVSQEESLQYLERGKDGRFDLRTVSDDKGAETATGLDLNFAIPHAPDSKDVLDIDFTLKLSWVQDREKVEGVNLAIGKPIMGGKTFQATIGTRINSWVCYTQQVPSRGLIYLFFKVTKWDGKGVAEKK